jgi:anaerobic ribonucleoside-triphosphate reductase activating protein
MIECDINLRLAVHAIIPRTTTNGPGVRFGIWVQGCLRHCPGCQNPALLPPMDPDGGDFIPPSDPGWITVSDLLDMIKAEHACDPIEGITVSGGEPFDQEDALFALLASVQNLGLSNVVFTGHTREDLMSRPSGRRFFRPSPTIDILIDGAYDRGSAVEGELRGSMNQRMILLTSRYSDSDLMMPGPLECIVEPDGSVVYTGFTLPPTAIG